MHRAERLAYDELRVEPNVNELSVPLCDALGVAALAMKASTHSTSDSLVGVALGSKSHAIGLGLAAIGSTNIELICRSPSRYLSIDVKPRGDLHIYEIRDRFNPAAYLLSS
jgi:hypothetical protein